MEETARRRTARLSDAWATRPARPREGRMVAGVAAAIGERYDIDPVLVRVGFATAAFFGPGIPLYLVGCAVLPDAGSAGSGRSRTALSTVLLVGAAVIVVALMFGGDGGWLAPLMVSIGLLALLHVTRGGLRGRGPADGSVATPAGASDAATSPSGPGFTGPGTTTVTGATTTPVRASGTPFSGTPVARAPVAPAPAGGTAAMTGAAATDRPTAEAPAARASASESPTTGIPATGAPGTGGPAPDVPGPTGPDPHAPTVAAPVTGATTADQRTGPDTDSSTGATPVAHTAIGAEPADGTTAGAEPADGTAGTVEAAGTGTAGVGTETARSQTPPSWDPLGAAPFAWDLPDLAPEQEPEPPARRSRVTAVTLALALLAAGGTGAAALTAPAVVAPAMVPAAALAVIGIGLVIGAFAHAGRWLLPFAAMLAVTTWLVAALPWADLRGGVGTIADAPTSATAVAPEYRRGVGDIALDMSGLDLTARPGAPEPVVRTSARVGIGSIAVTVPRDADIVVRGTSSFGDVTVDGQSRSGDAPELTVVDDGPDGPGGGRIELDVHAALGSVTVGRE